MTWHELREAVGDGDDGLPDVLACHAGRAQQRSCPGHVPAVGHRAGSKWRHDRLLIGRLVVWKEGFATRTPSTWAHPKAEERGAGATRETTMRRGVRLGVVSQGLLLQTTGCHLTGHWVSSPWPPAGTTSMGRADNGFPGYPQVMAVLRIGRRGFRRSFRAGHPGLAPLRKHARRRGMDPLGFGSAQRLPRRALMPRRRYLRRWSALSTSTSRTVITAHGIFGPWMAIAGRTSTSWPRTSLISSAARSASQRAWPSRSLWLNGPWNSFLPPSTRTGSACPSAQNRSRTPRWARPPDDQ